MTLQYQDVQDQNKVVGSQDVTGKIGSPIEWNKDKDGYIKLNVPEHYVLDGAVSLPSGFNSARQSYPVPVKHVVNPNDYTNIPGASHKVNETVIISKPANGGTETSTTQTSIDLY